MSDMTLGENNTVHKLSFKDKMTSILKSKTARNWLWSIFRAILLIGLAFVILFPLVSKVANSLKPPQEMFDSTVMFIPKNPTFENYKTVIYYLDYYKTLFSTVFNSAYLAAFQAIICTLVAYGFARFKFPGRALMFVLVIVTVVIPPQALIFPLIVKFSYFGFKSLFVITSESTKGGINLIKGPLPLILISITGVAFKNGLFIYLLRQYFKGVPKELEEAAFIDGAGYFKTFYKVMLPGAIPMMMTVFLFAFVWMYNDDFYWRTLQSNMNVMSIQISTVASQIYSVMQKSDAGSNSQYATILKEVYKQAAVVLHITPLALLYIFTQRFFVQSIERSGLVG